MKTPYHALPEFTRWSKSVAGLAYEAVDPVVSFPWRISNKDKVATAGSCFAQHIARRLRDNGFHYYIVEDGHPIGDENQRAKFNYGTFSARYGNIYTPRQLVQLFQRAYGIFTPKEEAWMNELGRYVDPFRPNIEPDGFATLEELNEDRRHHLSNVRKMFEEMNVFVFTLGLTEAWRAKIDGAVFPVCPGVAGGVFDESNYEFVNFTIGEIVSDLTQFFELLRSVNSAVRMILTVSPVPLVATAEARHVLVSTIYSKSVLRVACDEVIRGNPAIAYFPSYEIIIGSYNRGRYFAKDLRSVTEDGVEHVMRLFMAHVGAVGEARVAARDLNDDEFLTQMMKVVDTTCEEELIEMSLKS